MSEDKYLIYSAKSQKWFRKPSYGTTDDPEEAHRYSLELASNYVSNEYEGEERLEIVRDGSRRYYELGGEPERGDAVSNAARVLKGAREFLALTPCDCDSCERCQLIVEIDCALAELKEGE